jgi:TPP-dependent pyruvate/acetoin dehydrogenase alpha subunit
MDIDHAQSIDDFAPQTLYALCERIRRSTNNEQLVYREAEIDEIWRLIDIAVDLARRELRSQDVARLEQLKALTWEVHDLIGNEGDRRRAIELLQNALQ